MDFFEKTGIVFSGSVKLADIGSAFLAAHGTRADNVRWDVEAPEILQHQLWGLPADIWALACTMLELVTGRASFMPQLGRQSWTDQLWLDEIGGKLAGDQHSGENFGRNLREFLEEGTKGDLADDAVDALAEMLVGMLRCDPEARLEIDEVRCLCMGAMKV